MKLIIISGRSGSGKSAALHMLEDLNYYCVDNLPASLLPELINSLSKTYHSVAVSIDARNLPTAIQQFSSILTQIKQNSANQIEILYLDADDNTLLKRFSETRRRHPLNQDGGLKEAIEAERQLLEPIADKADLLIDTSHLSVKQLRDIIHSRVHQHKPPKPSLLFQSFGFKHGVPTDTDYIFDVRCLPNPYWEKNLREKVGHDTEVIDFFDKQIIVQDMLKDITKFLTNWLPVFEQEGRKYITVSIGCTGGQHRSVYFVEKLGQYFKKDYDNISVRHRELI